MKFINYLLFVFKSKGFIGFFIRLKMLVARFDLSGRKLLSAIMSIEHIGQKYNFKPALIIPGMILKRYSRMLTSIPRDNLEFAIHGHSHQNYKPMDLNQQTSQIEQARQTFGDLQIPCFGFRAPYLSHNQHTPEAVKNNHLLWESDDAFLWNGHTRHVKPALFHEAAVHALYNPHPAEKSILIPRLKKGGVVSIPVSLPDDEMLIDRFAITDAHTLASIWRSIMTTIHQRGEIFVFHIHPERMFLCTSVMDTLLEEAASLNPRVWITGMKDVADWWMEKNGFSITFSHIPDRGFRVQCTCSDRAMVLGRHLHLDHLPQPWFDRYQLIVAREFFVASGNVKPCIGVHSHCSQDLSDFLRDEGFPHEISDRNTQYSIFLSDYEHFSREDEAGLLNMINNSTSPLIRFWRWPDNNKSALVSTHDLDSMTIQDFVMRSLDK